MSLMSALLETYDFALVRGLVDNPKLGVNGLTLLPVYHSNKRSNGEDLFEITIGKNSTAVAGRFLPKEERVVFPITEDSITRSGAKVAPHAICDELSYLAKEIDAEKNQAYTKGIEELLLFEEENPCPRFRLIGEFLLKNTVLDSFITYFLNGREHRIDDKFVLHVENKDSQGKAEQKFIDLNKIFITFKVERETAGDLTLSNDVEVHQFYQRYVEEKNRVKQLTYCDITGNLDYCVERHRGIIGNAKLISISNNDETYYGRLKNGGDIFHISYEASQKVHNMLKYLVENSSHAAFLGEGAYVVNWLAKDLQKGGIPVLTTFDQEDEFAAPAEPVMGELGGIFSVALSKYFMGDDGNPSLAEMDFYVLIVEKISNGRVSIKHFNQLSRSTANRRICDWYSTTEWKLGKKRKSPSLYQIVDFLYGYESKEGYLRCEHKKLKRSQMERLIPCMFEAKKLPRDMMKQAFSRLTKRQTYKKQWDVALYIGCALIKKYKADHGEFVDVEKIEEVESLGKSISFHYGRLAAVYEKIELDAVRSRDDYDGSTEKGKEPQEKKGNYARVTNMDRLFTTMIRMPERTAFMMFKKLNPYMNILKKKGRFGYLDRWLEEINRTIKELKESTGYIGGPVNEDFMIGYYHQKSEFYKGQKVSGRTADVEDTEANE